MKSVNGCCEREERWEGRTAGEDKGRPEGSSAARILMAGGRVTWAGLWLCRLQRSGGQSSLDASRPQLGRLASVAAVWWGRAIHCRVFRAQGSGSRASLPYKLKIRDAVEVSRGGVNALHSPRTTPLRYGLFSGSFSGPKSCEGGMSFRQFHVPQSPMTSIASIFRHSSVQTTTICVRIPLPLWISCIPRPDKVKMAEQHSR